ncbi:hypothetical protein HRG_001949 [Hirsutella rhossiliensis]|uniref:Uncharacterized protein n=1 Tax=Hirsutella rhossiliensis TaxID=111463 RepID=A0A9P8N435_9HYPO|nr:uncharacterized protein HRG_01949 [Hirsutella rhossiliensis]KAH0966540.1 hypothetical protein HRG_01949 [Hirsutella rhossiliensis]
MDGFRDDEGALAFDSRELLTKSRLRRKRMRTRGPEADKIDSHLNARHPFFVREAHARRQAAESPKIWRVRRTGGANGSDSSSESESESKKAAKPRPTTTRANKVNAAVTGRPQRIKPIPVFATARPISTVQPGPSDRVAAIGNSSSPSPSRAPDTTPTTPPAAPPAATSSAPPLIPDIKAPQPSQSTETNQMPAAQESGFRFPGVEAAKEQDGGEKDLRAGRFSQGAEAGIVIGTLAFIALLAMVIVCYRRKRSKKRGVGRMASEKGSAGMNSPPRTQSNIMDEAMKAAYAANDDAYTAKPTPGVPPPLRVSVKEPENPELRPVHVAPSPPQNLHIYPPERAPADQYRVRSMPASDEPEEWRTWNPDQSQATRPLNWL